MTTHTIKFKTKAFIVDDNGRDRLAIKFKKDVSRADCSMKNHEHRYYNSDLFPRMLQRQYEDIKGEYRTWAYIDELPEGITCDASGFLAVVTVYLPESFK